MNKSRITITLVLLTTVLLGSCGGQPPASPTPDMNALLTESVGTLSASFFLTQTAIVPTATHTPLPTPTPIATNTPLPSPIASPTQGFFATAIVFPSVTGTVFTPTINPTALAYGCNNLGLVNNIEVTNGSSLRPNENFTKTWQVANTGSCNWLGGYRLLPISGTALAEDPVRLNNVPVPPNEWRQISVNMTAPDDPGTYTQYWQMSDGAGHTFGPLLGVTITVRNPSYP